MAFRERAAAAATAAVVVLLCRRVVKSMLRRRRRWPPKPVVRRLAGAPEDPMRVVILGAGVGGSFSAMWLREMFGDQIQLTVISRGPTGGRCQQLDMPPPSAAGSATGYRVECGAAIISEVNDYMVDAMRLFDLEEQQGVKLPPAVYDGRRMLFRGAFLKSFFWGSLVTVYRVMRHYGLSGIRNLKKLFKKGKGLPDFPNLYKELQKGAAYQHPEDLCAALTRGGGSGCLELTRQSAAAWLANPGLHVPEIVIKELVEGGMYSNYGGQGLESLHALVGLISIAGGISTRCFKVLNGNVQIMEQALQKAQAGRVWGTARRVWRRGPNDPFLVDYDNEVGDTTRGDAEPRQEPITAPSGQVEADVVLVAHHLGCSPLRIDLDLPSGVPREGGEAWGKLRRCVAHFFRGRLRGSTVDCEEGAAPPVVLTVAGSSPSPFYSIGLQVPTAASKKQQQAEVLTVQAGGNGVFKVFASRRLTGEELGAYFDVEEGTLRVVDWTGAYPEYQVPQPLLPFVLAPGVVYLNAIESLGAAMEMSAIAARNAVNLVASWYPDGRRRKVVPQTA